MTQEPEPIQDNEAVYDAQIAPLMGQIIALCKQHSIPFVACFQLNDGDEENTPLLCTSTLVPDMAAPALHQAYQAVAPKPTWHFTTMLISKEE